MNLSLRILSVLIWAGAVAAAPAARAGAPDGAAIYKQKCSMCHGVDGKGFSAIHTPDFTDPKVQASMTDKQMEEVIKNGKKGTAMPAFGGKLKDDEIQAVIKYLRSLNSEKKK